MKHEKATQIHSEVVRFIDDEYRHYQCDIVCIDTIEDEWRVEILTRTSYIGGGYIKFASQLSDKYDCVIYITTDSLGLPFIALE